jgi:RNA methyltransferase, TrmH family
VSAFATLLTRAQTARIRHLFRDKRVRNAEGAFIIEGAKPVYDLLLHRPALVQMLVAVTGYQQRETDQQRLVRESLNISSFRCPDRIFSALSDMESPQGIFAVVRQPHWNEDEVFGRAGLFGLYGEHLQDPANVGAIIRTAAALNVDALWLTPDSADIYNPKVVRATSGALLSLPIFIARDAAGFVGRRCAMFAAEAGGRGTVEMETICQVPKRLIVALGNESRGLSSQTSRQADCRFTIPLNRHIQSLNVAATAAIALHYLGGLPKKP